MDCCCCCRKKKNETKKAKPKRSPKRSENKIAMEKETTQITTKKDQIQNKDQIQQKSPPPKSPIFPMPKQDFPLLEKEKSSTIVCTLASMASITDSKSSAPYAFHSQPTYSERKKNVLAIASDHLESQESMPRLRPAFSHHESYRRGEDRDSISSQNGDSMRNV